MARWKAKLKRDRREWNDWFAWRPVWCEGERIWLEEIQRAWGVSGWAYRFKDLPAPAWIGLYE